ncbi:carbon-phosphorus lyase complex subunit PhnI [Pandoraea pulmonicola]|uniref:Bacterial phosphonate metabolism protein (PhnI) n=1 Tax=Pandoraea pulmonicola TaxID=93221 RepID=A0AAJ4ZBZ6_PANPU|nr:carbon-phosphorus lyase complex subunit PhnI [Pandoraea pulmonicola]AJC20916.1 carbon-phosphorus lyase complex subunit PhnI [Pandoraea pulmonicola]SUA90504.1 Bacterial phosphonate metabolism protein (PhnI) [Pandoraea pulmonicola]
MYVAVKGGERAIEQSWDLLARARRGDTRVPELTVRQIREQMRLAVSRVMSEGALYDETLAALAIKQAAGDLVEAIFLLRAYRTTLPRLGTTPPIDTAAMRLSRRISATFKDVPGGQVLGATYDYTQRLLDFALLAEDTTGEDVQATSDAMAPTDADVPASVAPAVPPIGATPRVTDILARDGLLEALRADDTDPEPHDLVHSPLFTPASRTARLQNLARGDEGFLLALGYSTQRGYGNDHPFAGEIRIGHVAVEIVPEELGFAVDIGEIAVTECQMVTQFGGNQDIPPQFTQGYGLAFGHNERKAMAMSLVDRALRTQELGDAATAPAQQQEFVLYHSDNVEASGFVQHLKLPHYVDFQAELELVRRLRAEHAAKHGEPTADGDAAPAADQSTKEAA